MIIQRTTNSFYDNTSQSQDENERLKVVKAVLYDDMKVGIGVKRDKK